MATFRQRQRINDVLLTEMPGTLSRELALVIVPARSVLEPGTVLGRVTGTRQWAPYDDRHTDGTETARGVLADPLENPSAVPRARSASVLTCLVQVRAEALIWAARVDRVKGASDLAAARIGVGRGPFSPVDADPAPPAVPAAPTAAAAQNVTSASLTAVWAGVNGAAGYRLDVSPAEDFSTFVEGYEDLDVGLITARAVTGLTPSTAYSYRVRAYNLVGTGSNSNTVSAETAAPAPAYEDFTTWTLGNVGGKLSLNGPHELAIAGNTAATYETDGLWKQYPPRFFAGSFFIDLDARLSLLDPTQGGCGFVLASIDDIVPPGCENYGYGVGTTTFGTDDGSTPWVYLCSKCGCFVMHPYSLVPPLDEWAHFRIAYRMERREDGDWDVTIFVLLYADVARTQLIDSECEYSGLATPYPDARFDDLVYLSLGSADYGYGALAGGIKNVQVVKGTPSNLPVIGWGVRPQMPTGLYSDNVTGQDFTAAWPLVPFATGYRLTVAGDAVFETVLPAYDALDIGLGTTVSVTGLNPATSYWWYVVAYNAHGLSPTPNPVRVITGV